MTYLPPPVKATQTRFADDDFINGIFYHLDCIEMLTKGKPPEWFDQAHTLWTASREIKVNVGFNSENDTRRD